jgi:glucose/mannose-6-phosphate isomerase
MEMKELVEQFPTQLKEALAIGRTAKLTGDKSSVQHVLICGLGGSGIGGTIVSELAFPGGNVPVNVSKGYFIPGYIGKNSLVIISSYSGNTEETIECMMAAVARKAQIVCVTSGGKIAAFAKEHKLDHIMIPGGMPPRSCLGYSITQLIFIFVHYGILPASAIDETEKSLKLMISAKDEIHSLAKKIAGTLFGKLPVIYCTTNNEGVAIRFRQQLNENAKILCWHHVIPEMNHNELVGWAGGNDQIAVVLFRDPQEYERNDYRIELNKEIISKVTPHLIEVYSKGDSRIEKAFYLIHLGDWISVYLADLRGVDAVEVNVINFLKGELSKK